MTKLRNALHDGFGFVLRMVMRLLILLAFRPKKVYASETARREALESPCVIISNHVRGMDGAVIQTLLPFQRVYSMSAKDLMDHSPALKWFLSFCFTIPVDREHVSLSWLREGRKRLKEGSHIFLFPEGYCNRARVVRPFKAGFVTLAASAGVKVLPIYHNGEYNYFFGKRFRMIIGEPVTLTPPPEGLTEAEMARETAQLHAIMNDLERQLNGFVRTELSASSDN